MTAPLRVSRDLAAPSGTVTAELLFGGEGNEQVAERIVTIGGKRRRIGTADDAGKLCVTARSPEGVPGRTYYWYWKNDQGAPGPVLDERGDQMRDPATGALLYDLDAAEEWNRSRPGSAVGQRPAQDLASLRRTELRHALLAEAEAGRLTLDRDGKVRVEELKLPGRFEPRRVAQQVGELRRLGAFTGGNERRPRLSLSREGRGALERFDRKAARPDPLPSDPAARDQASEGTPRDDQR